MPISQHPGLRIAANVFAAMGIGFGINAFLRPEHALTFFEWEAPTSLPEKQLVRNLLYIYGIRDIFEGLAVIIASVYGTRRSLGWTLMALSFVAVGDGIVCKSSGKGEWGHWSYAPILSAVGGALIGWFD
ncbi:hypothetical protein AJ79_00195 [Helicocarpus griseus UAMH5409]|uniref:Integral membrane protein n=1 Tax=Helicocarpus griseus UAMH5409 TaxID=1447875 RepID=A0A2B7YD36_9EURO|nr:hypothetical protein AJ79_00195 [Helicocarpus griseus UAMH5409]